MNAKLPADAFALYATLGPERSYSAVAEHFGVSKRAIVKCARREDWAGRLAEIETAARKQTDQRLAETISDLDERHRKLLRAMAGRAAKALQEHPLESGMDAIRAAALVIKLERMLAGQPSERTSITVESVTRSEIDRLIITPRDPDEVVEEGDDDW